MIKGIGIDIIELNRIEKALKRNARFIDRILTTNEKKLYDSFASERRKLEFLAGRFAAKEAFSKAAGTGIGKLSFRHMEVLRNQHGAPEMSAEGYETAKILISITHSEQYAVAQVILT